MEREVVLERLDEVAGGERLRESVGRGAEALRCRLRRACREPGSSSDAPQAEEVRDVLGGRGR